MEKKGKRERSLDRLTLDGHGRNIERFEPTDECLTRMTREFSAKVNTTAAPETVLRIFHWNSETMITFRNKVTGDEGIVAILPLNSAGHIALAEGRFDFGNPSTHFICRSGETPVSIYVWAISVTPRTGGGIAHAMSVLSKGKLARASLYCRAANRKAEQFFRSLGFQKGVLINGHWRGELMAYLRPAVQKRNALNDNRTDAGRPTYDSYEPNKGSKARVGVKVVHRIEELLQVFAVRSATYVAEQAIPYEEDFDGNDFCGTHLIGYVGVEPAACLRLRYFASFVKIERLAVMPQFRGTSVALRIVRAGIDFARDKGFTRFYGHTEKSIYPVWKRVGFVLRENDGLACSDREFFEGDLITPPSDAPITTDSGGYVIIRPEGQWQDEGILDKSSERGASAA